MSKNTLISAIYNKDEAVQPIKQNVIAYREERHLIPQNLSSQVTLKTQTEEVYMGTLQNLSRFGMSVLVHTPNYNLGKNEELSVEVVVESENIYSGQARVVSERQKGEFTIVGFVLDNKGIDLDLYKSIIQFEEILKKSSDHTKDINELVDPQFKILVADLHTTFQSARLKLLEEDDNIKKNAQNEKQKLKLEEQSIDMAISIYADKIHDLFKKFHAITSAFDADNTHIHKKYFRTNFHPLILSAPFVHRAFNKPLGYAGDYGLMLMFYEYEDAGRNLFDKFLHRFSCNQPSAVANKNRVNFLSQIISNDMLKAKDVFKISSVACGPAREICLLMDYANKDMQMDITLMDIESLALDHAREKIRSHENFNRKTKLMTFSEDAVTGIIKQRPFTEQMDGSNIIVSAGLFDYLSDRIASKMIERLFSKLAPGGKLIIGNVSKDNPDQFSMAYCMEWILVLRDEQDLINLVPENIQTEADKVSVVSESLGLNLFLIIEKKI